MQDMKRKGRARSPQGANKGNAKLRDEDIYAIRRAMGDLTQRYSVSFATLYDIAMRKRWKHLPEEES
jgi:hypothetical protein